MGKELIKYYITFKKDSKFEDNYCVIFALNDAEATKYAQKNFPSLWKELKHQDFEGSNEIKNLTPLKVSPLTIEHEEWNPDELPSGSMGTTPRHTEIKGSKSKE